MRQYFDTTQFLKNNIEKDNQNISNNSLKIQKLFNTFTAQNDFYYLLMTKKLFQFVEYPSTETLDMRT
jgi:hypothetical protein